jgi:three-Cys-motif partner protein
MASPQQASKWTCHKLECMADFVEMVSAGAGDPGCCVELFASPRGHSCRAASCEQSESGKPVSLSLKQKFSRRIYMARNEADAGKLAEAVAVPGSELAKIITGNTCHESVMRQLFDAIPRSTTSLVIIDPPGYSALRWSVIKKLALHGVDWKGHKMDLLILFPLEMALMRNLTRTECENSINRLYGGDSWMVARIEKMMSKPDLNLIRRDLVRIFKENLKGLGYKHVEDAEPARFSNPPYYHVIWASDRASRANELKEAWGRERFLPCEMFHEGRFEAAAEGTRQ